MGVCVRVRVCVWCLRVHPCDSCLSQILWRDFVCLPAAAHAPAEHPQERVHARRAYYGKPRYDIVQVTGEGEGTWYARLLGLFDVKVGLVWHPMALIHWMQPLGATHVPGAVTFRYWGQNPDVVQVESIVRSIRMLQSPRLHGDANDVCFVLLPYGKWGVRQ